MGVIQGYTTSIVEYLSSPPPRSIDDTSALDLCIWLCIGFSTLCLLVSEISRNYSQVDKLWSVTPWVYTWVIAYKSEWQPRCTLMAILATIWGIRLCYNFHRRGGYDGLYRGRPWEGEEDYRW